MLVGKFYINGLSSITAQPTFEHGIQTVYQKEAIEPFRCIEPDYKTYFNPIALRRLSRILKFSILTAQKCLEDAGSTMPDAIITGTGLGCVEDSEKFLRAVIEQQEENLSPTAFIFSTHNTISGQIAMTLKCNRTNNTFSNRYFSFESALLESMLMLKDGDAESVLVGSADEVIPTIRQITQQMKLWVTPHTDTSIMGEGACFAFISEVQTPHSYAVITALDLVYKFKKEEHIQNYIEGFLKKVGLNSDDIDLVISGESEEDPQAYDGVYQVLSNAGIVTYKHLIGEYFTASAFAYFLGGHILKNGTVPQHYLKKNANVSRHPHKILIYNQYKGAYHSLVLLTNV